MLSAFRKNPDLLTMGTKTLFLVYPYTHRTLCVFYQDIPAVRIPYLLPLPEQVHICYETDA